MVYYYKNSNEIWRIDAKIRFVSYGQPYWMAVQKIHGVPAFMDKASEEEIRELIRTIFKVKRVMIEGF